MVDILTGTVLQAVAAGTSHIDQLHAFVARFLDVPNDDSVHSQVSRILRVLDELGLIEPAGGC